MADVRYTHEKLGSAVQTLATHPGRIKERLLAAVHGGLHAVDPEAFSVPDMNVEARTFWTKIYAAITAVPKEEPRRAYERSIEQMDEEQACHIAQLIVSLDSMVGFHLENPS